MDSGRNQPHHRLIVCPFRDYTLLGTGLTLLIYSPQRQLQAYAWVLGNRTNPVRIGGVPVVRIAIVVAIAEVGRVVDTAKPEVPTAKLRVTPYILRSFALIASMILLSDFLHAFRWVNSVSIIPTYGIYFSNFTGKFWIAICIACFS